MKIGCIEKACEKFEADVMLKTRTGDLNRRHCSLLKIGLKFMMFKY